ncbi:Hypothetical_protein [Hexamita inflata]|uniref:Hypothetical_protein n=1 Tax=Hexamita inflata TaxID=28002 RepID=A0AA86UCN8_9EUKA|nr:Hypothetical protein HINF_LOCUS34576 [Hexamita inflata]
MGPQIALLIVARQYTSVTTKYKCKHLTTYISKATPICLQFRARHQFFPARAASSRMYGVWNPPVRHDQRYKRNSILVLNLASRMQTVSTRSRHQDRSVPHLHFSSILVLNLASLIHGRICDRLPTGVCGLSGCNFGSWRHFAVASATEFQTTALKHAQTVRQRSRPIQIKQAAATLTFSGSSPIVVKFTYGNSSQSAL